MTLAELPRRDEPRRDEPRREPRRDEEARARLDGVARRAQPVVPAGERVLAVPGELGALLPSLRRGSIVAVGGETGAGATTVALGLAAAATGAGEWAAAVEVESTSLGLVGGLAAVAAGVALDRLAVVRRVPPIRWATVVAALLDGIGLVLAEVPPHARAGDARRLAARARERGTVLVVMGAWPAEAAVRLWADGTAWSGLGRGTGLLCARELVVRVEGRGAPANGVVPVAHAG